MALKLLLLFIMPLMAGFVPILIKKQNTKVINILSVLGGSYLLCVCLYHLIPEAFSYKSINPHKVGLFILIGFIIQLLLEQFSHGIEHGHKYDNQHLNISKNNIGLFVSLSIHAFIESIPLAYNTNNFEIVLGISIHHIPIGILLSNYLIDKQLSKKITIVLVAIFSISSPLGYLLGSAIVNTSFSQFSPFLTALASGIVLYISTTILFESSSNDHVFNKASLLSIILGILIFFIINILSMHEHVH